MRFASIALFASFAVMAQLKMCTAAEQIVAIDVLLEPNAEMVKRAVALNARMGKDYPSGYRLGKLQVPHVSLVQRYVRQQDLPAIHDAVAKVCVRAKPRDLKLQATGIASSPWNGLAITSIAVARSPELDQFQRDIVKAVEPFAVSGGTAKAFTTNNELPRIEKDIVQYVETFVPKASGKNYHPHVTIGAAPGSVVDRLKAEPFKKFSFKPVGVAAYHLGSFGTAQKKLWEWKGE